MFIKNLFFCFKYWSLQTRHRRLQWEESEKEVSKVDQLSQLIWCSYQTCYKVGLHNYYLFYSSFFFFGTSMMSVNKLCSKVVERDFSASLRALRICQWALQAHIHGHRSWGWTYVTRISPAFQHWPVELHSSCITFLKKITYYTKWYWVTFIAEKNG